MSSFSVENRSVRQKLATLVRTITSNPCLAEELLQEALIHMWLAEMRRPGQTWSWYVQSCKFHLRHYLNSGRSVDSQKRRLGQIQFESDGGTVWDFTDLNSTESVFETVSARDMIDCLLQRLTG